MEFGTEERDRRVNFYLWQQPKWYKVTRMSVYSVIAAASRLHSVTSFPANVCLELRLLCQILPFCKKSLYYIQLFFMDTIFASIFNQKEQFKMRTSVAIFFATHCDVTLMETSTYSCCSVTVAVTQ